jgi:hypothetical protein
LNFVPDREATILFFKAVGFNPSPQSNKSRQIELCASGGRWGAGKDQKLAKKKTSLNDLDNWK